jgi:CheY-like chemotaxis protein
MNAAAQNGSGRNPKTDSHVTCRGCGGTFDACFAEWCACERRSRTLRCTACGACFCSAPQRYQQSFWARAPLTLREDPHRFRIEENEVLTALPAKPPVQRPPTVLVVDDDEEMRSLVVSLVEHLGYGAIASADPREALLLAQRPDVDVIISDALMPTLDGREMCRRIKETSHGAHKKTLVMTSLYVGIRYSNEAFAEFKVDGYVKKPLDLPKLAELLGRLAPLPLVPAPG